MSINNIKKPRGRPRVDSEAVLVRMSSEMLADIDKYIDQQKADEIGRPEAIRRLVELGLKKGKR